MKHQHLAAEVIMMSLIALLFGSCRKTPPTTLSFSSFDGGGPRFTVTIDDESIVTAEETHRYKDEDHDRITGAGYDVIFTFTGLKTGTTRMKISADSTEADNRDRYYIVTVDEALKVAVEQVDAPVGTVTFINEVEETDVWILPDTEENRKLPYSRPTIDDLALNGTSEVSLEAEGDYVFHMFASGGMYYGVEGVALRAGGTVRFVRQGFEFALEVTGGEGNPVSSYEVFGAMFDGASGDDLP